MATPRFRLATLLRLREDTRDERRAQLAEAMHADDLLQEQTEAVQVELTQLRNECADITKPGQIKIDSLMASQRYEIVLRSQQDVLARQSKLLGDEIERRRLSLVEADREVSVLEKLREKQRAQHRAEEAIAEMKLLDEVALRSDRGDAL